VTRTTAEGADAEDARTFRRRGGYGFSAPYSALTSSGVSALS
jgi:hypothetical protein